MKSWLTRKKVTIDYQPLKGLTPEKVLTMILF